MNPIFAFRIAELILGALGLLCLLWHRLLGGLLENRLIRQIEARERCRQTLTRRVLIREALLSSLDVLAGGLILACLILLVMERGFTRSMSLRWHLLFALIILAFLLVAAISVTDKVRRLRSGEFRFRRYMISGYRVTRTSKGDSITYYLGTNMGDTAVPAPLALRDGTWYYVVVMDGKAVLTLRTERWEPDSDLRRCLPPEDWEAERQSR